MSVENGSSLMELTALAQLEQLGGPPDPQPASHLSQEEAHALYMRRQERESAQPTKFRRVFNYRPHDGAVAFQRVLLRLFGTAGVGVTEMGMFGPELPSMVTVRTGLSATLEVPWGKVAFPIFGDEAYFRNQTSSDPDLGQLYYLSFTVPKRFSAHVRGLFREIEKELATNSIYRGKAFDGNGQYLDLSVVDPGKVVYSDQVLASLNADLWSLIDHSDLMRSLGVPLKHAVLLAGEYGTGKTLAGLLTGQRAIGSGWTFIQCRPGKDDYEYVMQTARLYQPCVAFFEDIDTVAATGEDDPLSRLLEVYDGATAKGAEILAVFTTNHEKRLHKAMVRPGRIDAVIPIGKQDASSVRRMIEVTVAPSMLDGLDYQVITEAMTGFTPAFVKEAVHRAMRHAIVREGHAPSAFVTADFVNAAASLQAHLELMAGASEGERPNSLENELIRVITDVVNRTSLIGEGVGIRLEAEVDAPEDED